MSVKPFGYSNANDTCHMFGDGTLGDLLICKRETNHFGFAIYDQSAIDQLTAEIAELNARLEYYGRDRACQT